MSEQSVRAKILRFAEENRPSIDLIYDPETGYAVDDPDAHLSGLLDAFAHELAEKIRQELPERVKKLTGNWAEIRTVSTAQHAADLIDPNTEAQR